MSTETIPKVLIVGAGMGGLTLAAILEQAKIPYEIFERASTLKPLGSAMSLGPPVMPMLAQLGLLDRMIESGVPVAVSKLVAEKGMKVIETDLITGYLEKFNSLNYIISRPKLQGLLLELIPPERIHFNKRVVSHVETGNSVIINTSDNMTHEGNILVGADGTYSAVRKSLYEQLEKRGKLPSADKEPLKCTTFCLVGQTRVMEPATFDFPKDKIGICEGTLNEKLPYLVVVFTTAENTICWMVVEFLDQEAKRDESTSSEWGPEAAETMCKAIRHLSAGFNMTMGDLIDATPKEVICKVMLEEKLFETWTSGRTVLLGDACHKMTPTAGLGAQTAINDAVVLANYIYSLTSIESKDIEAALNAYKKERYPHGKAACDASASMTRTIKPGFAGDFVRAILGIMPHWLTVLARYHSFRCRPQIAFLPRAEDKGTAKPLKQPSLHVTRSRSKHNDSAAAL